MPFIAKYMVYLSDTDAAGIVHFANYLRFVERAEEDFYRSMGLPKIYEFMPRIEAFIRYESPIRRGDSISVELSLEEARTRAVRYGFNIFNDSTGIRAAYGHVAAACVEMSEGTMRAIKCPREVIEAWTKVGGPT
ncbi:thioesterase [Thermocladium modestius]|uniref:Thioesterase n=1 Tax=Thermocladium modestius TaxID=62609 RepID=A0A830GV36_9CREN|nr:thioesterase family protein [Thermocladium modestius]GGP20641.1 thioesterase [Thermocladium modestius]